MNSKENNFIKISIFQSAARSHFEERKKQIYNALLYAEKNQIQFICFPEGFLTGYYDNYEDALKNSLEVNHTLFLNFLSEIQFSETTIILGFIEKSSKKLYNSVGRCCFNQILRRLFLKSINFFNFGIEEIYSRRVNETQFRLFDSDIFCC